MKDLITKLETIAKASPTASSAKDVLDDLVSVLFNMLTDERFNDAHGLYKSMQAFGAQNAKLDTLEHYGADYNGWMELQTAAMMYLKSVNDAKPFEDLLGIQYDIYLGKKLGQFLTPPNVAVGAISFAEDTRAKPTRVVDYACGAGALILGALRHAYGQDGLAGVANLHLYANDLDMRMCRMVAVQVLYSSIVHRIPVGLLFVQNLNAITEYEQMGTSYQMVMAVA